MSVSWIPVKDVELLAFAQNFSTLITATATAFGLVAADATLLATNVSGYSTALTAAITPGTRTSVTIANKDVAKATLLADIRALAKRIQATASVTPGQKESLGLPIHKDTPTPIPAPSTKPMLNVIANGGRTVRILIKDETTPQKKAKPPGYEASAVYTYVQVADEAPPADLTDWRFEGLATRSDFEIAYRPSDVGKTSYILANWLNPRGEAGPNCEPIPVSVAA